MGDVRRMLDPPPPVVRYEHKHPGDLGAATELNFESSRICSSAMSPSYQSGEQGDGHFARLSNRVHRSPRTI